MILEKAIIKTIITDYRYDLIEKLDIRWFSGDNRYLFHAIAGIHIAIKKAPTYERVKEALEAGTDLKQYIKDSCIDTLKRINEEDYFLPENPIRELQKDYEKRKINEFVGKINQVEHNNKKTLINELAESLKESVSDSRVYNLQNEINLFAEQLAKGEANADLTKAIEIKDPMYMKIWGRHLMPFPYIIAARPGDYKTSLLINLSCHLWQQGKKGLFFSLEDNIETLRNKYIAVLKGVDKETLTTTQKCEKLATTVRSAPNKRMHVIDKNQSIKSFRASVDGYMRKFDIDYIMLDYVQLFSGERDDVKKLSYVARETMYICKDYGVPFIFTSQVNDRDSSQKESGSRLHMGHLKGSGALEENAAHIALMYGEKSTQERIINIGKNRFGTCGEKTIYFDGKTGRVTGVNND